MEPLASSDPARIGPFRLVARLGRGGMGRVYLGRAESTGRAVAVKTVHGELLADAEFRLRFSHEVAAARRVRDEYIAEVVDADPDGATPWLATAYVPGISVEDAVRRFGPLPADSVRVLGLCVGRAVAAIHAVGLVHRDLKPGNVLLTAAGPKVIDFGIARGAGEAGLTRTGMVSGSPPFMAPEQLNDGGFGPASDVFSLGAILHYAATATGPYGRGGAQEQYARALAVGPVIDPALPRWLAQVVGRCFHQDPHSRPSAADVAQELETHPSERPAAGWLPNTVVNDILVQATDALNKDSAAGFAPPSAPPPSSPSSPRRDDRLPREPKPEPRSRPPQHAQPPQHFPPQQYSKPQAQYQSPVQPLRTPPPRAQPQDRDRVQDRPLQPPPLVPPPVQPRAHTPPRPNTSLPNTPLPHTPPPHTPQPYTPPPNGLYPPQPYPQPPQPQPPYGMQSLPPRPPYAYPPMQPTDNSLAVTALVLALVGIIVPCLIPVAIPFGIVGLNRSRKAGGIGFGQAFGALVVCGVLILGWITIALLIANSS
jgi:serine/threonine protein kinase